MRLQKPSHGLAGAEQRFYEDILASVNALNTRPMTYVAPDWNMWWSTLTTAPIEDLAGIVYLPDGWIPTLADQGRLLSLDTLGEDQLDGWKAQYPKRIWERGQHGGRQYGVPVYGAVWTLMYNRHLLQAVGYTTPPATWDELHDCCRRLKRRCPATWPYGLHDDTDGHFCDHGFIYVFASGHADLGTDEDCRLDHEWAVKGLDFLAHLVRTGLATFPRELTSRQVFEAFFHGKIAMVVGPSDLILEWRQHHPDFPLGVARVPTAEGGESLSYASYGFYAIPKGSADVESIVSVLDALVSPSNLDRLVALNGMLPVHCGAGLMSGDPELAVFCEQLHHSGVFPAWNLPFHGWLTDEMLLCLRQRKSAGDALAHVTDRINLEIQRAIRLA